MGVRALLRAVVLTVLIASVAGSGWAEAARKTPPGNPPGNNGSIKVGADADPEPNNEPHVDGCRVWLEFFGFDTGERVRITFETHSPTGPGVPLLTHEAVVSDDPAAGGQDEDDVLGFNLSEALQPIEPDPQLGFHLEVSSDSLDAPGGAKHKVFWLHCSPAPPGAFRVTKLVQGANPGPFTLSVACNHAPADRDVTLAAGESAEIPVPMGTTCAVRESNPQGASIQFSEQPSDGNDDGQAVVTGDVPPTVTVTNVFADGPARESAAVPQGSDAPNLITPTILAEVAGAVASAPEAAPLAADMLPRTGAGLALLAGFGASTLALGGLTLFATRRRR